MSEAALETPEVEPTPEVGEDSAVTELKKRNAGLQRKVQELLAAQEAASREKPAEAERETMPEEVTDTVEATLREQQNIINALLMERWQAKAVAKHPEAAAFADLLVGGDEAQVMSLAEDIANRIKGGQPSAEAVEEAVEEAEAVTESTPTTTVSGGAPEVRDTTAETDEQELARLRADLRAHPGRSWKAYLDKKFEMAAAEAE